MSQNSTRAHTEESCKKKTKPIWAFLLLFYLFLFFKKKINSCICSCLIISPESEQAREWGQKKKKSWVGRKMEDTSNILRKSSVRGNTKCHLETFFFFYKFYKILYDKHHHTHSTHHTYKFNWPLFRRDFFFIQCPDSYTSFRGIDVACNMISFFPEHTF